MISQSPPRGEQATALLRKMRRALRAAAGPERAPAMQAYMNRRCRTSAFRDRPVLVIGVALMTFFIGSFALNESHRVEIWKEVDETPT